jgi:hypothetical protein
VTHILKALRRSFPTRSADNLVEKTSAIIVVESDSVAPRAANSVFELSRFASANIDFSLVEALLIELGSKGKK